MDANGTAPMGPSHPRPVALPGDRRGYAFKISAKRPLPRR